MKLVACQCCAVKGCEVNTLCLIRQVLVLCDHNTVTAYRLRCHNRLSGKISTSKGEHHFHRTVGFCRCEVDRTGHRIAVRIGNSTSVRKEQGAVCRIKLSGDQVLISQGIRQGHRAVRRFHHMEPVDCCELSRELHEVDRLTFIGKVFVGCHNPCVIQGICAKLCILANAKGICPFVRYIRGRIAVQGLKSNHRFTGEFGCIQGEDHFCRTFRFFRRKGSISLFTHSLALFRCPAHKNAFQDVSVPWCCIRVMYLVFQSHSSVSGYLYLMESVFRRQGRIDLRDGNRQVAIINRIQGCQPYPVSILVGTSVQGQGCNQVFPGQFGRIHAFKGQDWDLLAALPVHTGFHSVPVFIRQGTFRSTVSTADHKASIQLILIGVIKVRCLTCHRNRLILGSCQIFVKIGTIHGISVQGWEGNGLVCVCQVCMYRIVHAVFGEGRECHCRLTGQVHTRDGEYHVYRACCFRCSKGLCCGNWVAGSIGQCLARRPVYQGIGQGIFLARLQVGKRYRIGQLDRVIRSVAKVSQASGKFGINGREGNRLVCIFQIRMLSHIHAVFRQVLESNHLFACQFLGVYRKVYSCLPNTVTRVEVFRRCGNDTAVRTVCVQQVEFAV